MHSPTIASITLQQLGGNRFAAMTGAKNFSGHDNTLEFKLPRGFAKNKANHVAITLDPSDTYTMSFYRYTPRAGYVELSIIDGLYFDQLCDVFTAETGLYTSL